jgi:DNA-binding transcriptional LysR family regulator
VAERGFSSVKEGRWEDLYLFLRVAQHGGLSGAAGVTGISAPTVGRRMLALERSLGRSLFLRSPTGYRLTEDGQVLFQRVLGMEAAARPIGDWQSAVLSQPIVSLGTDFWTLRFLAQNFPELCTPDDGFRTCFKVVPVVDLTYREMTVGVSDKLPDGINSAARVSHRSAYAVYRATTLDPARNKAWISLGTDVAVKPWERWVFLQPDPWITTWTNTPASLLELVRCGAGCTVLPCFVGDANPTLIREGDAIAELAHDNWIVMHDDDRHRPEVRSVIDRLAALFAANRALFRGQVPAA